MKKKKKLEKYKVNRLGTQHIFIALSKRQRKTELNKD